MRNQFLKTCTACLAATAAFSASGAHAATAQDTFDVTLTITDTCAVTAGAGSNIDLGSHPTTDTNIAGSNTITVNCSNTTPYFIGLAPSNSDTTGAGEMGPAGASPDTVPYQLRSTAGMAGTIWGNTATTTTVGNGVGGTGNGANQTLHVYATAASANYTPDVYSDTVTVTVNY